MPLSQERDLDELRPRIEAWLGTPVNEIKRPAPGWSCETLLIDRTTVLRLPPVGEGIFPVYDLAQQAAVQEALADAGVPVAAPCRYEPDDSYLGVPFVSMPFVDGPIPNDFTPADPWINGLPDDEARHTVWASFVGTMVAIHGVPVEEVGIHLRAGLVEEIGFWDAYIEWASDGAPPAALREVVDWCAQHKPEFEPGFGLLWGDVRLGNVVFDDASRRPRAVLDFDMASAGPIEVDVAWHLAVEGMQRDLSGMTVPGFGSRDDTIELVEAHIGRELLDLAWYETFALARASAVWTRIATLFARHGERPMFGVGEDPALAAALRAIDGA
jgi:aminoglycoside phosphotransferase (APT) family kinase protein